MDGLGRWVRRHGVLQDLGLERRERGAGLKTQLLGQPDTDPLIDIERLRLTPGAVEGEHQLCREVLPRWLLDQQALEFPDDGGVAPELYVGVDPGLQRG